MNSLISCFDNIRQVSGGKDIALDIFLDYIRDGYWQDKVLAVRTGRMQKSDLPYVTISGTFSQRNNKGLIQHSGYICVDIDDVDPEETKSILAPDKYVHAAFTSVSGQGLAVLFKINPEKHEEAFRGLQSYLFSNYRICIDSLPDVSRPRYVSYDPHMWQNNNAQKFTSYVKDKAPAKVEKIVFAKDDFEALVAEIQQRNISLCDDYHTWLRMGFAISDKFGEGGRQYFHYVSAPSGKYNYDDCNKQYDNCLKAKRTGITIATFYYYCKQAGLRIYSERTKLIATAASHARKGGRTAEQAIENIEKFEGIAAEISTPIVQQVFENDIEFVTDESILEELEQWLRHNYNFRRNVITRYIEDGGRVLTLKDFNSIYIAAKKVFDKLSYDMLERLINSDFTPDYNPLIDWLEAHAHIKPKGTIERLFGTIQTDKPEYAKYFGAKWVVGIIASIYGEHSPLMFVLSGVVQNTGKTQFWRRFLPDDLRAYYGESKLDAGKDDEILMTQKILIMDDEMGGKSKKDEKRLKELLSKQVFSLREPYGRNNVDLTRLAVLCGTSNDNKLLNDPTGNRRIIPLQVNEINHEAYNEIDKTDVIMEAYHLYKSGWQWELTKDDIKLLNKSTERFEAYSNEYELITKYFKTPTTPYAEQFTATDIKVYIEKYTNQRLAANKIGVEMQRLGFEQISSRRNGAPVWVYSVELIQVQQPNTFGGNDGDIGGGFNASPQPTAGGYGFNTGASKDDLPF